MALTVPFAEPSDLEARWRPLSEAETARASVLLEDASQLILDEDRRGIFTDAENPASLTLVRIVCAMTKRALISTAGDAAGVSQTAQSAGPFTVSATYSNPTGDLYLTSAERKSLGFGRQRAGSVDMWAVPESSS